MAKYRPVPRTRRVGAIRPPKSSEMEARRVLQDIVQSVQGDVSKVIDWMKVGRYEPIVIANALQATLDRFERINTRTIADEWVNAIDDVARERLTDRISNTLGVNTAYIFDDENVRYAASLMSSQTANLIKDVSREYIQNVTDAAIKAYQGIPFPEGRSLTQQIMHLDNMAFERARTIARHQTSVINTAVNQARQTSIGIEEYYWSTANDSRVVGNPNGLYPDGTKAHGKHWDRDYRRNGNKSYRWDTPFDDGLPGQAINCRCIALPKIDTEKMNFERILIANPAYAA